MREEEEAWALVLVYRGPIHTVKSDAEEVPWFRRQPQSSMDLITGLIQNRRPISSTSQLSSEMPKVEDPTVADILEQTKGIRQAIANLHDDVLQLRVDQETHLSNEEKEVLKLAAGHLIQTIHTSKIDDKTTVPSNERSQSSSLEQQQQNQPVHAATSLTELKSPKCLPVQQSVLVNSTLPRVPSKATVIAINNDDDQEMAYEDDMSTNEHVVISADHFENIPSRNAGRFQDHRLTQVCDFQGKKPSYKFSSDRHHRRFQMIESPGSIMFRNAIRSPMRFNRICRFSISMISRRPSNNRCSPISIVVQN